MFYSLRHGVAWEGKTYTIDAPYCVKVEFHGNGDAPGTIRPVFEPGKEIRPLAPGTAESPRTRARFRRDPADQDRNGISEINFALSVTVLLFRGDQQKRRAAQLQAGPRAVQASSAAASQLEKQEVKPPAATPRVAGQERTRQSYIVINSVLLVAVFFCFCIVAENFGWKFGHATAPGSLPVSTLPAPSQFLIRLTDFLKAYWWALFIMGGFLLRRVFGGLERRAGLAVTSAVLRRLVNIQVGFLVALCVGGLLIKS